MRRVVVFGNTGGGKSTHAPGRIGGSDPARRRRSYGGFCFARSRKITASGLSVGASTSFKVFVS
jgi:hypothetical protein